MAKMQVSLVSAGVNQLFVTKNRFSIVNIYFILYVVVLY